MGRGLSGDRRVWPSVGTAQDRLTLRRRPARTRSKTRTAWNAECTSLPSHLHAYEKSQVSPLRYLTFWQGQKDVVSPAGSVGS